MTSHFRLLTTLSALAVPLIAAALSVPAASAQDDPVYAPGQPIVTGFSGTLEPDAPPAGSDPLDYTLIDPDGPSMRILALSPDGPPAGQSITAETVFAASATDVGQVFGVTLDNAHEAEGALAPNIYLSATSAFGLNIVVPDATGNPVRSRTGAPEATYMPGQWGSADGATGYPGSIWKVDGETGEITLFTTIAANTGASLGDIAYDAATAQLFVSDLDTGLIYRLDIDGVIADTFDHGVTARPEHGLDPVEDDGSAMDITDPAFNSEDPATWGFTPAERRVYGLALNGGRLFYTSGRQVWSVRIQADGSFGAARWELDIADPLTANEATDILFDPQGRMILAQRGAQVASYDYSTFAESGTSSVVRYEREFPADPATPGTWVEEPDSYAIGFAEDGANASGGIALGPRYNDETGAFDGACSAYLWATGDSLRFNPDIEPALDEPFEVSGLQGNARSLVRPQNDPPRLSFFADYDGNTDDDQSANDGHVGGVAIWQQCESSVEYIEPPVLPPAGYDPGYDDEDEDETEFNLTLEKWAKPYFCFDGGADWHCSFTIRVENTGDEPYWGPVVIDDYLPDSNPGAVMDFWPQPPWDCNPTGATEYQCSTGPVLLYPGDGIVLHEVVTLPKALVDYCELPNVAGLNWFWHDDDDSSDDFNLGVAGIKAPGCVPGTGSDLTLNKVTFPTTCADGGATWNCSYAVIVQNAGPDNYSGPITVTDTLGINAPMTTFGPWACGQAGPVLSCNILAAPVNVPPGWTSGFLVTAHVPKDPANPLCNLDNRATITSPAGGTPTNVNDPNDDDDVTSFLPDPACFLPQPDTDLEITKQGLGCAPFIHMGVPGYLCDWKFTYTNIGPDDYHGPLSIKDTTAGATMNSLAAMPACIGTAAQLTCTTPVDVTLLSGDPHPFNFVVFYPDGPDVCSVTNNVSILTPNPGSTQNPSGNDSASDSQEVPNIACLGLPKLNIQKTATGCDPDPSSPDWLCEFDISVVNLGAAPQAGPIDVHDFNDKPTTFSGAVCPPAGPGAWKCTLPGPLNPGDDWSFTATTRVDPNGVTLADCNVENTVWITNPMAGDPGHISQATQKVPQLFINLGPGPMYVYCDPPSLALSKVSEKTVKSGDGYNVTFRIRADSLGPDPYHGTVELDEILPDGTTYVDSSWPCVPTTGNDMHCSSPPKEIPVGKYTTMTITIHIPSEVAIAAKCNVVNTVNAAISAEVLHSDVGAQYTASAAAKLPASLCREPNQCPVNQVMPGGGCCEEGLVWNGKQCATPRPDKPACPEDSHLNADGKCVCDKGTEGRPGKCEPIQSKPVCPDDSHLSGGKCVCDKGTEGRPGRCEPIEEDEPELSCPKDSRIVGNECVCRRGTEGTPGKCRPIEEEEEITCPRDSRLVDGECVCRRGTEGKPGNCRPIEEEPEELSCPKDSRVVRGECVCRRGTEGIPGQCQPIEQDEPEVQSCPSDSHFDTRRNRCVCNRPLRGEPGQCIGVQIEVQPQFELKPLRPSFERPTIR